MKFAVCGHCEQAFRRERAAQRAAVEAIANVCLEERVPVLSTFWGDPTPYVARAHATGVKVIDQVASLADAQRAARAGVDVIVAQGMEAGGDIAGEVTTRALVLTNRRCGGADSGCGRQPGQGETAPAFEMLRILHAQVVHDCEYVRDLIGLNAGDRLVRLTGNNSFQRQLSILHDDVNGGTAWRP